MDVLQDVKRAEAEASSVEEEYRGRADQALSSVSRDIDAERERRQKELDRDVSEKRAEMDREVDEERARIKSDGESQRRTTQATSGANADRAAAFVLDQL